MCLCVLFVLPLCVSNIVCVFSFFFILSEVLMNKDVYINENTQHYYDVQDSMIISPNSHLQDAYFSRWI